MSQSLCNSLFLHFYIFLQCEDVLNIVSYIVPPLRGESLASVTVLPSTKKEKLMYQSPYGAKVLQDTYLSFDELARLREYQSPYGAKVLQVKFFYRNVTNHNRISPLTGRKSCKTSLEKPHRHWGASTLCGAEANSALFPLKIFS